MRFLKWIWRGLTRLHAPPSTEAVNAAESAMLSNEQSRSDLLDAQTARSEAEAVIHELRRHNSANRYDEWLARIARGAG